MVDVGSYEGGGGPEAFCCEEEVSVSGGEVGDKLGLEVAGCVYEGLGDGGGGVVKVGRVGGGAE